MSRRIPSNRRTNEINVRERYQEANRRFINEEFTYSSHCLLKKLCQNGSKQPHMHGVPIYKLMIEITKTMMMNELELLFFGATVQEMGWKVIENCLTPYIDEFSDITPKIPKDLYVKKMQLSLLLIAYIVKIYLNDDASLYDFKIRDLIRNNFDSMYQQWVQKVQNNFKFSPKHMNKLFKELDKGKIPQKHDNIVDYNMLVAELFKDTDGERGYQPYYERTHPIATQSKPSRPKSRQNESLQKHENHVEKEEGLPVQQDEPYKMPALFERGISGMSQVSGLGMFTKKESQDDLFAQGDLKPSKISQIYKYSQDQGFL